MSVEMGPIRDLTVDPDDGLLLVASQSGIYKVDYSGRRAQMSAPLNADFWAVSIAALPGDHWYSLAYRGPESAASVLTSEDDGQSWAVINQGGMNRYGSLAVSPGNVSRFYLASAEVQALQFSVDGGQSFTPAAPIAARGLVLSADSKTLFAATKKGLAISTDSGSSFTTEVGSPPLLTVAVDPSRGGALSGIGIDGTVWERESAGSWKSKGSIDSGVAQAQTIDSDGTLLVALEHRILASNDGGQTWSPIVEIG